jgi:hypothetical protein
MKAAAIALISALTTQLGSAEISFLRRDLSLKAHYPNGAAGLPWFLRTADFNGDGRPDLVTVGGSGLSVFLNTGTGDFAAGRHNLFGLPGRSSLPTSTATDGSIC